MIIEMWNVEELNGYKPITTFWMDFSIADKFGHKAVQDTYNRAFRDWKNDYKYLTELVMVLNHKAWQHHGRNQVLSEIYVVLYEACYNHALETLKGEELKYFFSVTD